MPSGGRRARSGPPQDPNALRRGRSVDRAGWTHLPNSGREGDPPPWPLTRPTKFELATWAREWTRPQAIMWERLGLELQVAIYVRTLAQASKGGAAASRTTILLRQMNDLGLSVPGLAANRWIIDEEPAAAVPRRASSTSAKDRLTILKGGADARAS